MSTTTLAIADDHQVVAQAFAELITKFDGYEVLYIAEHGRDLIDQLTGKPLPDILLLDLNMPVMNGFATAEYFREHFPQVKILALSMMDRDEDVARMIQFGVRGYLLKGCRPSELRQALADIQTKGFYYSEFLTRHLLQSIQAPKAVVSTPKNQLNDREQQFLKLSCSDMTYAEIADKMCVSTRTVDGYREAIFQKFNVKSRVGMVMEALRNGTVMI
jgi:two-component system, NarL family, invasion response regulator UvrY